MPATIQDVAKTAGVSIATVSHVINKTRYVSPDLIQKVENAIQSTGYQRKIVTANRNLRVGRLSEIVFVVPNIRSALYSALAAEMSDRFTRHGFLCSVCLTNGDIEVEQHVLSELLANRRVAGIVLVPSSEKQHQYKALMESGVPFVCIDQDFKSPQLNCVLSNYENAIFMSTSHLLESGHENIALLLEKNTLIVEKDRLEGYRRAYREHRLQHKERNILYIGPGEHNAENPIRAAFGYNIPSAFIAGGNRLTLFLLKTLEKMGLECPKDVSVIGFGDDEWCDIVLPPLTTIRQDTERISIEALNKLLPQIMGEQIVSSTIRVPTTFTIRKSTQTIGWGPFGEKAFSAEDIALSNDEIEQLHNGCFSVCIAFHYTNTAWAVLHEKGIRDTLTRFGVKIMSVADAHFDPAMQVTQLEGLAMQSPDAIIAIPADDRKTAEKFKEISKKTKLVFISNVPEGFDKEDYCSCVSVNERENGQNAGVLLGEHFRGRSGVKVGFISHGTPFYGTHLRDAVAAQVLKDRYPNIEIVANEGFYQIGESYEICRKMVADYPEIEGLYISWDRPALEAMKALTELKREDIAIVTCDLDMEIGLYLAQGKMVCGMSTQRPYEQGVAVAQAVGKALLGQTGYKYIGVPPSLVTAENLSKAWRDILKEPLPVKIEQALNGVLRK